jgi:hypothetical protein
MTRGATMKAAFALLGGGLLAALAVIAGPAGPAGAAAVTVDLYASTGSTTLPGGQTVPVWGYRTSPGSVTQPGGPPVVVQQGDTVTIQLHNGLGERTGLLLQGQPIVPDLTGTAAGGTATYTFTAGEPGTYLYEAALLPNAQHQIAMGLYGALVVQPSTAGRAYGDAGSAFDDEAVLLLSEIDPALNNAADKAAFDLRTFAPRYFLVNGVAHPATTPIPAAGGDTVLLRYVNAGSTYHSMGVLGARQTVIALDGSRLDFDRSYVAETFGPGQTADALVTAPQATTDTALSVYDAGLTLRNGNTVGFGGMLTSIDVTASLPAGGDTTGPVTSAARVSAGTLTATVDDTDRGGANVTAAEYFLDTVGTDGAGTTMSAASSPFDAPSEGVTAPVTIPSGNHVLYVHGRDADGNWGPLSSVLVTGADVVGPATSAADLTPGRTNHSNTGGVALTATGSDVTTGGSAIAGAEYSIDGGAAVAMTVSPSGAPVASLDATVPATVVNGLAQGSHTISLRSRDAAGNWGAPVTLSLVVDTTAPITSGVSVAPSPNNGTLPINASSAAVRLSATTLTDPSADSVNSPISAAEAFIDTVGTSGSGIPLNAGDGVYSDASESGYADIPLATVRAMSNGAHVLSVHAKDAAGNWGPFATTTLVVDKTAPTVSGLARTPNPTGGATSVTLTGTATDAASAITAAEWFIGTDPGAGNATPMTLTGTGTTTRGLSAVIDVRSLNEGSYTIRVRAKDAAGNWGTAASTTLTVSASLQFSTVGSTNPPGVAGTADDADIYGWNGTAFSRVVDVTAAPYGLPATASVDGFDRVDGTRFYLSFSGLSTTVPGIGTVQDEDVVYWNGSAWSVYFNGTAHGLTSDAHDVDAFSVVGTSLYFSTLGNANPPGAGGTADDADIYRWNGSTYARVWDASANGLAAGANVDGLVWTDANHLYLSFSPLSTTVPVLGGVPDEDVVFDNAGTWSRYFDGSAHGLGTDALDLDAFDIP